MKYNLLAIYDNNDILIAYSIKQFDTEFVIKDNEGYTIVNMLFDNIESYQAVATCFKNSVNAVELINL